MDTQEIAVTLRARVEGRAREGGIAPLLRRVRGISPEKIFDIWLPLFAFLMHFGCILGLNFSSLGLIWHRRHLHIHNGTLT